MAPTRLLLCDDHALVRAGFRILLEDIEGVEVIAETGDGRAVFDLVESARPDIILMDVSMPGLNGLDATAQIRKRFPSTRVIVLSMYRSEEYIARALKAGASGYVLKEGPPEELRLAINAVNRGETYLSPAVSQSVIHQYLSGVTVGDGPLDRLTARQREILQLIAEGKSNKAIARLLNLSVKTVDTHRSQIMERLDIHELTGLVRFAIRCGLVTEDR